MNACEMSGPATNRAKCAAVRTSGGQPRNSNETLLGKECVSRTRTSRVAVATTTSKRSQVRVHILELTANQPM
eukprot:3849109-Alexandrium_andersonii.AAC.1